MTKDDDKILDWRSTGRRKARRELFKSYEEFKCWGIPEMGIECGATSIEPPKDAPSWFDDIWPEEMRVLDYSLQADHKDKDWRNNELDNLCWRCAVCHKKADSRSAPGEAQESVEFW